MNGPQHYVAAEQALDAAYQAEGGSDIERYYLASAQVHATLALAAATAGLDAAEGPGGGSATGRTAEDAKGWAAVLGEPAPAVFPDMFDVFHAVLGAGVALEGWWAHTGDMLFGVTVAKSELRDWDADWMAFQWDSENGWTMDSGCAPGAGGSAVLVDVADPFDPEQVAAAVKAVVSGEITEFRSVAR